MSCWMGSTSWQHRVHTFLMGVQKRSCILITKSHMIILTSLMNNRHIEESSFVGISILSTGSSRWQRDNITLARVQFSNMVKGSTAYDDYSNLLSSAMGQWMRQELGRKMIDTTVKKCFYCISTKGDFKNKKQQQQRRLIDYQNVVFMCHIHLLRTV